ncbi:hypothetical protein CDL12_04503 [Handroanthus impetiginosus]|uniref:Uncharacterized protein n=1 Tax=Handroanthus impetiginosus TaxID=429701 RepID=A0A2G9HZ54_9LAMI|nr:hypothetical protein CDL12_04503 [Handroanthus impetiginosus]
MGPVMEVGENLRAKMKASTYKANGSFAKELEDELMKFTINSSITKVDTHLVGPIAQAYRNADVAVNVTECTKSGGPELAKPECSDATESSSSFDDCDTGSDSEDLNGDSASSLDFGELGELFRTRNRKTTTHWRSFIQPVMWRCKWVELQIKKFDAQAEEYEKKLEKYNRRKQFQLEKSTLEGFGMKSLPLSQNYAKHEVLKRKKRRRAESTTDIAAYMSHHNLFSYYENRKCFTKGAFVDDAAKATRELGIEEEFVGNDEMLCDETGNNDNYLERIYRKIERLQSQVAQLKSRVDNVIRGEAENVSSADNAKMPIPGKALTVPPPPTAAASDDGDRMPMGTHVAQQLISQHNMGDFFMLESAVTSHGEFFCDAYKDGYDEVLIDNHRVKEQMNNFEEMRIQPIQRPSRLKNASNNTNSPVLADPAPATEDQPRTRIQSTSTLTSPNRKSKRTKRRGAG